MSQEGLDKDSESAWLSYTSGESIHTRWPDPASQRSSWATSKFSFGGNQSTALPWLDIEPPPPVPPLPSKSSTATSQSSFTPTPRFVDPNATVPTPSILHRPLSPHNGDGRLPTIHLFNPPTIITPPPHPILWERPYVDYLANMAQNPEHALNMRDMITRLDSDEDPVRKMAVFKLQSSINDPAFAEVFIQEGGLGRLRYLILQGSGNTLAYALSACARLLELDLSGNRSWEVVDSEVIERVVELVVCHPLVNILRGAMAILACVVARPLPNSDGATTRSGSSGFQALKPAIAIYPQFLEMLVSRLSSADHSLCANALQLINSLMRDVIANDPSETEWPRFIKRLQDLGVIKAVYVLMQSSALQDLAHPLLEFQQLTKLLLRRWRDIPVDLIKPEHRRIIKGLHLASNPERYVANDSSPEISSKTKHNPFKWRRLGFATESPESDFADMGFLGMMDLSDFVRKQPDDFQIILADQTLERDEARCPFSRASLIVSAVLYEHFEIERQDWEDQKTFMQMESRTNFERVFKPLLLHWSRLHVAALRAFFRLWKATGAVQTDFARILELVRILVESVVGGAVRGKGIEEVEKEMEAYDLAKLRALQMELLELTYEDVWGQHLESVREELMSEALQFAKEQRVRCLLAGAWFPIALGYRGPDTGPIRISTVRREIINGWRFVRLDESRKFLHYADYDEMHEQPPEINELVEQLDLATVTSVVSNVTATGNDHGSNGSSSSQSTLKGILLDGSGRRSSSHDDRHQKTTTTRLDIMGYLPSPNHKNNTKSQRPQHTRQKSSQHSTSTHRPPPTTTTRPDHNRQISKSSALTTNTNATHKSSRSQSSNHPQTPVETVLLSIHPPTNPAAAEWLDGLLMLMDQQPITAETNKLVQMMAGMGVKVRLLNVRTGGDGDEFAHEGVDDMGGPGDGNGEEAGRDGRKFRIPSREGLDQDYYYRM